MANPSPDKGNAELLPCPFCGVQLTHEHDDGIDFYDHPHADCIMSGAEIEWDRLYAWNRRAAPPSPSTAPEVKTWQQRYDELSQILHSPKKANTQLTALRAELRKSACRDAEIAELRAALASRPAEVDDDGLPQLPQPMRKVYERPHGVQELLYFTAEQYRQGQRDAVAADRARRDIALDAGRFEALVTSTLEVERNSNMDAWSFNTILIVEQMIERKPKTLDEVRAAIDAALVAAAPSHTTNKENG